MTHWRNSMVNRPENGWRGLRHGLDNLRPSRARGGCGGLGFQDFRPAKVRREGAVRAGPAGQRLGRSEAVQRTRAQGYRNTGQPSPAHRRSKERPGQRRADRAAQNWTVRRIHNHPEQARAVPGASPFHRKAVTTSNRSKHETMLLLRRGRGAWSAGNAGSAVDVYRTVARRDRLEAQPDGGLQRVQQHQG
jgi:hypothetical protein